MLFLKDEKIDWFGCLRSKGSLALKRLGILIEKEIFRWKKGKLFSFITHT